MCPARATANEIETEALFQIKREGLPGGKSFLLVWSVQSETQSAALSFRRRTEATGKSSGPGRAGARVPGETRVAAVCFDLLPPDFSFMEETP